MFAIVKKENSSIADLQEKMINDYLDKYYSGTDNENNSSFYSDYYIN